jgi:hypothetical protein
MTVPPQAAVLRGCAGGVRDLKRDGLYRYGVYILHTTKVASQ